MALLRYKYEPFQDWLDEKIDLPVFEEIGSKLVVPPRNGPSDCKSLSIQHATQNLPYNPQLLSSSKPESYSTQSLLQEFETVLGGVEACLQATSAATTMTLTPPQSPSPATMDTVQPIQHISQQAQLLQYQQERITSYVYEPHRRQLSQQQYQIFQSPQQNIQNYQAEKNFSERMELQDQWTTESLSVDPFMLPNLLRENHVTVDVQKEIADVDEYVRSCAENAAPSSPFATSSETGSYEDSSEDPDCCTDNEWKLSKPKSTLHDSFPVGRKLRSYVRRGPEDKRVRKKEQNKNAATRYRLKKKQEIKEILSEEQLLVLKNDNLIAKANDLQREIGYLKNLMRDLCRAKGLIK